MSANASLETLEVVLTRSSLRCSVLKKPPPAWVAFSPNQEGPGMAGYFLNQFAKFTSVLYLRYTIMENYVFTSPTCNPCMAQLHDTPAFFEMIFFALFSLKTLAANFAKIGAFMVTSP